MIVYAFLFSIVWFGIPVGTIMLNSEKAWMQYWNRKSFALFIGLLGWYIFIVACAFRFR